MPKAVQVLLKVVLSILFTPGGLAIMAFPVVLAIKFPTQATANFLGLILAVSGVLLVARELYSWRHTQLRVVHALIHPSPAFWVSLLLLGWGFVLCIFSWPHGGAGFLGVITSFVAGPLLLLGWSMPVMWMVSRDRRAEPPLAPAQEEHEPVRRRTPPLLGALLPAWVLSGCVIGYALLFLTLNGQLAGFLATYLSSQPPFGLPPFWLIGFCVGLVWGYQSIVYVPASLRLQPRRQRFLFLLARKTFGGAFLGYGILLSLELSHTLPEEATAPFLELLATLAGMAGLTYLAVLAVVRLIRWRETRQNHA